MPEKPSNPLRVVLIEDSPKLCEMLKDMLEELGDVEVVADADDEQTAIAALERQAADLAIVDLELREGSGLGVLGRLKAEPERFGKVRAVVFSNYGHRTLRSRCAALGADRFFDKSMQLDELIDYVEDALRRR